IEFNANWLPSLMGAMDKACHVGIGQDTEWETGFWDYSRSPHEQPGMFRYFNQDPTWPYSLTPSEYVKRQIHVSFMDDPVAIAAREIVGVDTLMWGNDYPHAEGTYPHSREAVDTLFSSVPANARRSILGGTAARIFGITLGTT